MSKGTFPTKIPSETPHRVGSDVPFYVILGTIGGVYILLIIGLLVADVAYMVQGDAEPGHPGVGLGARPSVVGDGGQQSDRQGAPQAGNSVLHQAQPDFVYHHHDPVPVGGRAGRVSAVAAQVSAARTCSTRFWTSRLCCRRWSSG